VRFDLDIWFILTLLIRRPRL